MQKNFFLFSKNEDIQLNLDFDYFHKYIANLNQ